jgi:MEMO1 family protein
MTRIRTPIAAGRFYPRDPAELAATVDRLLDAARPPTPVGALRALVAPHAGYFYSGAVAATAFACLRRSDTRRIALLGPSHFVALRGLAVSSAAAWRTPLGDVPVDDELREVALAAGAPVDERPHESDHALEVELPFLQRRADAGLRVIPIAVGAETTETAGLVAALAAAGALVVVSSDLSHYLAESAARARDARTAETVVALDDAALTDYDACGAAALRGLLAHARGSGWTSTLLHLATSADTTGERDRVVGYGAFALVDGPA